MNELCESFSDANLCDTTLCLFGYWDLDSAPQQTKNIRVFKNLNQNELFDALSEADLYIMNSNHYEGFGLVLLEAMYNGCEWASRRVGGAESFAGHGFIYDDAGQLINYMKNFVKDDKIAIDNKIFVENNYMSKNSADDIEKII